MKIFEHFKDAPARLLRIYDGAVAPEGRHFIYSYGYGCLALWWIRKGSVCLRSQGDILAATTGDLVLVGVGENRQDFSDDAQILSINYTWNEKQRRPFYALKGAWKGRANCESLEAQSAALSRCVAGHFGNPSPYLPNQVSTIGQYLEIQVEFHRWLLELALLMEHLGVARSDLKSADARAEKACELLENAPLDVHPDYESVAKDSGVSRAHLERLFRFEYHLSPHAWFERRRMEFALQELSEPAKQIKEISLGLGFNHLSRFSNWFSKIQSMSPRAYRQQIFAESAQQ